MTELMASYHDNVREDAIALVPQEAGRILDFGGGVGATAAALKRRGNAVWAAVADQVSEALPEIDLVMRGDLEKASFITFIADAGPFDTILCLDILEHLRDPWEVVQCLIDALRPGGTMIVSVPNVNNRGILLPLLFKGKWELTDKGLLDRTHLRWFTKHSLIAMLDQPGLEIQQVKANMIARDRWICRFSFGFLERFLAVQYIVRATKR